MKNPYNNPVTLDGAEAPPSIPSYTVEELYTDVWKSSVTMDEEEPPPIPPHSAQDYY